MAAYCIDLVYRHVHVIKAVIGKNRWIVARCFIVDKSVLKFVNKMYHIIVGSKIDDNRYKQILASLPCYRACR